MNKYQKRNKARFAGGFGLYFYKQYIYCDPAVFQG